MHIKMKPDSSRTLEFKKYSKKTTTPRLSLKGLYLKVISNQNGLSFFGEVCQLHIFQHSEGGGGGTVGQSEQKARRDFEGFPRKH